MASDGSIRIDTSIDQSGIDKGLKEIGEKLKDIGDKVKETGKTMSEKITAPIVGFGAAALLSANALETSQGKIQAQLGTTSEEAKKLGKVAQDVWKNNFGESVADVSDAIVKVKQYMGDLSETDLKNVTESAYTLSDAFGADVNDSVKTAGTLIKNFHIDGQKAMDIITTGFQKGGDYSGELLDTLNEYSPQFSSMGMKAEEFLGILVSGAKNGAFNLDKVGDAVKEFNIRAQDGSQTTAQGFQMLHMNAKKMGEAISKGGEDGKKAFEATIAALAAMKDPMQQNIAGTSLFGTQWEDLRKNVIMGMKDGVSSIKDVSGATKEAGDALYNNIGAQSKETWRQFLVDLQPVGEILLKLAKEYLPQISSALQSVASWFDNLSPSMQTAVIAGGALLAAIGPILVVVGNLITAVGTIIGVLTPLGPILFGTAESAGLMSTVFAALTGPIGIIIAAVIGLIAIFVALWKNNEQFREIITGIWNDIKNAFMTALNFIWGIVRSVMSSVMNFFGDVLKKISSFWDQNGKNIMTIVNTFISAIWLTIKMYMGFILGVFQAIWPVISGVVQIGWALIKAIFMTGLDVILGIIKFFSDVFTGNFKGAMNSVKDTARTIWNDICKIFKDLDLYKIGQNIVQGLINGWNSMVGAIKKTAQGLANLIPDGLKKALGIHSPSKVLANEVGKWIPKGLSVGIDKNLNVVSDSVNKMAETAIPVMPQNTGILPTQPMRENGNPNQTINLDGSQMTLNVGGYQATGLINHITRSQQILGNRQLRNVRGTV